MSAGSPERKAARSLTWKTGSAVVSGGDEDCVERVEAIVASASLPLLPFSASTAPVARAAIYFT